MGFLHTHHQRTFGTVFGQYTNIGNFNTHADERIDIVMIQVFHLKKYPQVNTVFFGSLITFEMGWECMYIFFLLSDYCINTWLGWNSVKLKNFICGCGCIEHSYVETITIIIPQCIQYTCCAKSTMPQSYTPQYTICNRNVHVCTFLLQNGVLWDIGLAHSVICEMCLNSIVKGRKSQITFWIYRRQPTSNP